MSSSSTIEWTEATWNAIRGCVKVSPGCRDCYAEKYAETRRGIPGHPYEQGFDVRLVPERLADPIEWKRPRMVFVNSMSDLFQAGVVGSYIEQICRVMQMAYWHTFQALTKRDERMQAMLSKQLSFAAQLPNIWWGVSVEDRTYGLPRIDRLRNTPACNRFLSIEPLLEDLGEINLDGIHWVITGGESGTNERPMAREWVVSIREQCEAANVPFFFKQWGGQPKKKKGRLLDGRTYDAIPERLIVDPAPKKQRKAMIEEVSGWTPDQKIGVPKTLWVPETF